MDNSQTPAAGQRQAAAGPIEPVSHTVVVPLAAAAAFNLFAGEFNTWWPGDHIGEADLDEAIIEPKAGGRWYERGKDGSECDWGEVLEYDPPDRLVMRWQLNAEWKYDPDPAHGSTVEVAFTPEGPDRTRVRLEHRDLDRHGPDGQAIRDEVGAQEGWPHLIQLYADLASA